MLDPAALGLWLRVDATEHTDAMVGLIQSGDLLVVSGNDAFGLVRAHANAVSRFEAGPLPPMPAGAA